jgi:hypothetical protein
VRPAVDAAFPIRIDGPDDPEFAREHDLITAVGDRSADDLLVVARDLALAAA